jgi:polysaccharide chain length determinant protein (PEP-CTERM system associated)
MDELIRQVGDVLRGMWRRRWIGVAAAWAVALAGAIGVARVPDRYEATARVYVDTHSLLQPLLSGLAIQPDIEQQVGMLARTLVTRPNIEKLVSKTDLDAGVAPGAKDKLVDQIMKELRFSASGRDNVYNVSFRDTDRAHAQRVVQALVSMFVESGLGNKRRDTESTRKFIDDQIASLERRLQEAENRLKEFRLRNMAITSATTGGQDYVARMAAANEDLNKARFELRVAEQSRDALKRELAGEEPSLLPDIAASGPVIRANPELDARIDLQKRQLDELLRRYTEEHPDVAQTKRMIASLEEQKRQEVEARRKAAAAAPPKNTAATNPVFQQIRISLTEAEANVAALTARVAEMQTRAEQLRASANRVPQVEAELAQLNRDYDIIRQNYQQMVSRREALALTGEVDESTGMAEFRIIDPPRVGDKPVFPNRMVLVPLLLVVAIGVGGAIAFLASQLMPTIHSTRILREVGQRPVLGSLSLRPTAAMLKRQRVSMAGFAASVAGLIAVYGAWLVWLALASKP